MDAFGAIIGGIMNKQNPFSVYDFLGYLIPGFFFLVTGKFLLENNIFLLSYSNFTSKFETVCNNGKIDQLAMIVILGYIVGHLISFISSITVERYSIWTIDYPSAYILNAETDIGIFNIDKNKFPRIILRILSLIVLLPIVIFDRLLGYKMKMNSLITKGLDPLLEDLTTQKIVKLLLDNYHLEIMEKELKEDVDAFRLIYHYCVEHMPNHFPKLQNYVALYGFSRTMTFVCISFSWIFIIQGLITSNNLHIVFFVAFIMSLISYLFYVCFNKFYRKFSLEAIMALTTNYQM